VLVGDMDLAKLPGLLRGGPSQTTHRGDYRARCAYFNQ
jgi:hypothetical protein